MMVYMGVGPVRTVAEVQAGQGLVEGLREQAVRCLGLGSPLSHEVLVALAELAEAGGPLTGWLGGRDRVGGGDRIGLRLLVAAHRMVLCGMAAGLAQHFPTVGGALPCDAAGRAALRRGLVEAFAGGAAVLGDVLDGRAQGNETGRALPLREALGRVAAAHGHPVRLHELGAAAGLNLLVDRLPWAQVRRCRPVRIVERRGCDLRPLAVADAGDRLTLASHVWGDDLAGFDRLRTAVALARRVPVAVDPVSITRFLADLAETRPVPGQTLVLWHSDTWFDLDYRARFEMRVGIRKLASRASASSPLVHLSWEPAAPGTGRGGDRFALVGRSWPAAGAWAPWRAGTALVLGTGPGCGMPMTWVPPEPLDSDPLPCDRPGL